MHTFSSQLLTLLITTFIFFDNDYANVDTTQKKFIHIVSTGIILSHFVFSHLTSLASYLLTMYNIFCGLLYCMQNKPKASSSSPGFVWSFVVNIWPFCSLSLTHTRAISLPFWLPRKQFTQWRIGYVNSILVYYSFLLITICWQFVISTCFFLDKLPAVKLIKTLQE